MPFDIEHEADDDRAMYMPSEAQIRRACLAIQQTWPAAERRKRAAWAFQWEPVELTVAPYPGADPLRFEGAPSGVL